MGRAKAKPIMAVAHAEVLVMGFAFALPILRATDDHQGATSAGFQRQRLSLVRCVPPHQRSIGLWREKSSLWATTALPESVRERRLRPEGLSLSRWVSA